MNKSNVYCVIMAGGSGSRLWPVSRTSCPKQFLHVTGNDKTLLRQTYDRFSDFILPENIVVVTSARFAPIVEGQIPELLPENLLLEPYTRNTAPCIAWATYTILHRNPDATIIFSPSDNYITDQEQFRSLASASLEFADREDVLVTLGIVPNRPDPNYGYIQVVGGKGNYSVGTPAKVKTFTEKPDRNLAEIFVDSGEFLWNSGIFAAHASVLREEMETYNPEVTTLFKGWENAIGSVSEKSFIERAYTDCPWTSFDYSLLERTLNAWIMPCDFRWLDIGNWASVYDYVEKKDEEGNASEGGPVISRNCRNTLIINEEHGKLVAAKGLDNFIVVNTEDALLICPKDDRSVKELLSTLAMPQYEKWR